MSTSILVRSRTGIEPLLKMVELSHWNRLWTVRHYELKLEGRGYHQKRQHCKLLEVSLSMMLHTLCGTCFFSTGHLSFRTCCILSHTFWGLEAKIAMLLCIPLFWSMNVFLFFTEGSLPNSNWFRYLPRAVDDRCSQWSMCSQWNLSPTAHAVFKRLFLVLSHFTLIFF